MKLSWKCVLAAVAAVASPGMAQALNAPFYAVSYFSQVLHYGAGSYSGSTYSSYTASLTSAPSLSLDMTATPSILSSFGQEDQYIAQLFYQGQIVGPAASSIPIDITYSETLSTFVPVNGYADAQTRYNFAGTLLDASLIGVTGSETLSGTQVVLVSANTAFNIGMSATETMYAQSGFPAGQTASVFMDPMVSIDPSFGLIDPNYRQDYKLVFSSGIQNLGPSSAAPEPETWVLLISGLVFIGGLSRSGATGFRRAPRSGYSLGA